MSAFISQSDLDQVVRRIAPISTRRLGQALYRQRRQAGMDRADVAGLDDATLDDYESARHRPDGVAVLAILDVYGCSLDDLVPERLPWVPAELQGKSDAEVVAHYLASVRAWRQAAGGPLRFRQADLDVLVAILGTDPDEILRRLVELTGCSHPTAKRLRLLLLGGVALAGVAALGGAARLGATGGAQGRSAIPAAHSALAGGPGATAAVPVVDAAASSDYAFWGRSASGAPYRWNPARAVTVAYLPAPGAPAIDVAGAVADLARATGLKMRLLAAGPADITIAFVPELSGREAGSTAERWDAAGFIDHAAVLLSEQTPRSLLHEALLHELGHAVGLDHAPRPGQVMNAVLTGQKDYQAGDLAGLRALGPLGQPAPAPPG